VKTGSSVVPVACNAVVVIRCRDCITTTGQNPFLAPARRFGSDLPALGFFGSNTTFSE